MDAAEEPALVDRGARAEREPVDVIELELIRGAADSSTLERPRAAPAIARPDPAPDLGGDIMASERREEAVPRPVPGAGLRAAFRGFSTIPRRFARRWRMRSRPTSRISSSDAPGFESERASRAAASL